MTKRMLVDATHDEETRVAIVDERRLVEFDYESKYRKPLKGSIFLAKVTRVEPSLQAAFVNFGGNRHGFLPFSEIHPDYFRIPISDREALLAEQQAAIEADEEAEKQAELQDAAQQGEQTAEGAPEQAPVEDHYDAEGFNSNTDSHEVSEPDPEDDEIEIIDEPKTIEEIGGSAEPILPEEENEFSEGDDIGNALPSEEEGDEIDGNREEANIAGSEERNREGGGRRQGRGRGRHGGGGRGRGRHRMAYNNRKTEKFGGEEYSQEDRFRYSLRRKYKIQEVIKRGQIMLVQVSKEERGNKGAAVSTYLSLPGRYCVLMPNSPRGGGVSRKIANYEARARMRDILKDLTVPQGMSVIVRTAGVSRSQPEVTRDLDYLLTLWDNIRELTLQSSAPALVYEEADLIKRAIRDLYDGDTIDEVIVAGAEGFKTARNFMNMMIPTNVDRVVNYTDENVPLFNRYHVEEQIAEIGETRVNLPSGGYLIINPTEALVSVDVNSGKATKERHIEETALKTNLEAASELARQLRLRDLGGLIVIDFIDMEDRRNNGKVERRMRDALSSDRARLQMGRISSFGLMELSRQRMNPSLTESQFEKCPHCDGMGRVRTSDATSIMLLRAIEEHATKNKGKQIVAHVPADVALYLLNYKRETLGKIEARHGLKIFIRVDESVGFSTYRIDVMKGAAADSVSDDESEESFDAPEQSQPRGEPRRRDSNNDSEGPGGNRRRGRRGGRNRRGGRRDENDFNRDESKEESFGEDSPQDPYEESGNVASEALETPGNEERHNRNQGRNRNRNRGGRTRPREDRGNNAAETGSDAGFDESPRDHVPVSSAPAQDSQEESQPPKSSRRERAAPEPREYEQVNEDPGEKKRGWWSR